ncbi:uncharacterized protein VP01_9168g1, partial [Puccinia sorghi]
IIIGDNEGGSSKTNIPKLDKTNYLHGSMRMKAHLRHKGLIKYIMEVPAVLAEAAAKAVNRKHTETVDILMNYVSETVFEAIVTPDNEENPYKILNSIVFWYDLTSVNRKGWVWYEYRGVLKDFIANMHRMLTEIALVKLGVPDNILSFSILAKLSEDLYNMVDNIIINEIIVESPNATLTKLQEIVHLEESRRSKLVALSKPTEKAAEEQGRRNLVKDHTGPLANTTRRRQVTMLTTAGNCIRS